MGGAVTGCPFSVAVHTGEELAVVIIMAVEVADATTVVGLWLEQKRTKITHQPHTGFQLAYARKAHVLFQQCIYVVKFLQHATAIYGPTKCPVGDHRSQLRTRGLYTEFLCHILHDAVLYFIHFVTLFIAFRCAEC